MNTCNSIKGSTHPVRSFRIQHRMRFNESAGALATSESVDLPNS